jgi:hypothetical protein
MTRPSGRIALGLGTVGRWHRGVDEPHLARQAIGSSWWRCECRCSISWPFAGEVVQSLRAAGCSVGDHVARHAGIKNAQALLGHADVGTTQMYTGAPTLDELAAAPSRATDSA